jgi:hypothetical protein
MGVIYRARQRHSRRIVAVKRILTLLGVLLCAAGLLRSRQKQTSSEHDTLLAWSAFVRRTRSRTHRRFVGHACMDKSPGRWHLAQVLLECHSAAQRCLRLVRKSAFQFLLAFLLRSGFTMGSHKKSISRWFSGFDAASLGDRFPEQMAGIHQCIRSALRRQPCSSIRLPDRFYAKLRNVFRTKPHDETHLTALAIQAGYATLSDAYVPAAETIIAAFAAAFPNTAIVLTQ